MSDAGGARSVRMIVSGRVQGVGFRYFTRDEAMGLALVGWVKNLPGGEVEVRVRGPEAALEAFRDRLRHGPPGSRVDGIAESQLDDGPQWSSFRIEY